MALPSAAKTNQLRQMLLLLHAVKYMNMIGQSLYYHYN